MYKIYSQKHFEVVKYIYIIYIKYCKEHFKVIKYIFVYILLNVIRLWNLCENIFMKNILML